MSLSLSSDMQRLYPDPWFFLAREFSNFSNHPNIQATVTSLFYNFQLFLSSSASHFSLLGCSQSILRSLGMSNALLQTSKLSSDAFMLNCSGTMSQKKGAHILEFVLSSLKVLFCMLLTSTSVMNALVVSNNEAILSRSQELAGLSNKSVLMVKEARNIKL